MEKNGTTGLLMTANRWARRMVTACTFIKPIFPTHPEASPATVLSLTPQSSLTPLSKKGSASYLLFSFCCASRKFQVRNDGNQQRILSKLSCYRMHDLAIVSAQVSCFRRFRLDFESILYSKSARTEQPSGCAHLGGLQ